MALLAHALVDDRLTDHYERLSTPIAAENRPANLDNIDGPNAYRLSISQEIISAIHAFRHEYGPGLYTADHTGAEAALALAKIDPSAGWFKDPASFLAMRTQVINMHDELKIKVDCSCQGAAEGTLARRLNCYNSFERTNSHACLRSRTNFFCSFVFTSTPKVKACRIRKQ